MKHNKGRKIRRLTLRTHSQYPLQAFAGSIISGHHLNPALMPPTADTASAAEAKAMIEEAANE